MSLTLCEYVHRCTHRASTPLWVLFKPLARSIMFQVGNTLMSEFVYVYLGERGTVGSLFCLCEPAWDFFFHVSSLLALPAAWHRLPKIELRYCNALDSSKASCVPHLSPWHRAPPLNQLSQSSTQLKTDMALCLHVLQWHSNLNPWELDWSVSDCLCIFSPTCNASCRGLFIFETFIMNHTL